jgi:hypothetical protein
MMASNPGNNAQLPGDRYFSRNLYKYREHFIFCGRLLPAQMHLEEVSPMDHQNPHSRIAHLAGNPHAGTMQGSLFEHNTHETAHGQPNHEYEGAGRKARKLAGD